MQRLAQASCRLIRDPIGNSDSFFGWPSYRTKYLYDGSNFVQEQNAAGATTATLLTGGVDELFGRMTGAGISVPLTDALGNVIGETGSAQTVTTSFAYEPYGKTTQTGTSSGNSQQYTGRENDGIDLYYYRARYYSPSTARFISEDPIGFGGGTNIYAYAGGSPVTRRDPSGLIVQFNRDPLADTQMADLAAAYAQIGQSWTGAMLINQLENSPLVYTITNTTDPMNGSPGDFNQYTNTIHVNPGYHPVIPVTGPCRGAAYEAASTREVLEHELGHATGVLDEIANMDRNVNPFRAEMGLPALSTYSFIGGFQYFTPTTLPYTGTSLVLPPAR